MATELMQFYFWKTDITIINDREEKNTKLFHYSIKKKKPKNSNKYSSS